MAKTLGLTLLLYLATIGVTAQDSDSISREKKITSALVDDAKNTGSTILYVYKRPFQWQKKEWLQFGAVGALTFAATFADEPLNDFFEKNETHFFDQLASAGDFLGQPEYNMPFYLAFWGTGLVVKNEWMRNTGAMVFTSFAVSGIVQTIAKEASGRARPSAEEGNMSFKPFEGGKYHSFPSGHGMLSISTAWILARQTKPLGLKIAFYSVPAVVSWSRLYDNAHWLSDIVLGSALGIASAEAVLKYYPKIKANNGSHRNLVILPNNKGFSLVYNF